MKKFSLLLALCLSMMFTACGGSDAEANANDNINPGSISQGNGIQPNQIVRFGSYQQDSSQKTPINWIALKVEGDRALLMSLNLISSRSWDDTGKNLTWDDSSIRQWLNNDFLNAAFSKEEINNIIPTELDNSDQHGYGTPAGKNTTDRVFLLSINEFESLVKNSRYATAAPTQTAKSEGAYANDQGNSAWWLRSPGMTNDSPAYLSSAGELGTRAHKATEKILGIRPAIWIKISKQ